MKSFHFLALIGLLFIVSCSKDDDSTSNPNDPCLGIICENGGTCVNGDCQCPEMWTGSDCSQQKEPAFIRIRKVEVLSFPEIQSNGQNWDISSVRPDIYLVIKDAQGSTLYSHATFYENALTSTNLTFDLSPFIELSEVKASYSFQIYDYDSTSADDFMSAVIGQIYNDNNQFPSTIDLSCSDCTSSYRITLEYLF